ncbi:MAG TPA: hypothetical protein VGO91_17180 [Pyrinomonadaceae bacterium]|jgi:hypothetical protein|nr:hypothetical protein [Pyrinomonadaceae bacterium]
MSEHITPTPLPGDHDEIKRLTIKSRIEAVQEAAKRARSAFIALIISSLSILITMWNAYGSWNRFLPLMSEGKFATSEVTQTAQKELLAEWIKDQTISVGLLGIRISATDAALLGSIGLYVITIWFYYSIRRMNNIIGSLLVDTRKEKHEFLEWIYYGVTGSLIFSAPDPGDRPIKSLRYPADQDGPGIFVRYAYKFLFFLPVLAIVAIVVGDILSLVALSAPFRQGTPVLIRNIINYATISEWAKLIIMELVAVLLILETLRLCWRCVQFENGTENVIKDYHEHLKGHTNHRASHH